MWRSQNYEHRTVENLTIRLIIVVQKTDCRVSAQRATCTLSVARAIAGTFFETSTHINFFEAPPARLPVAGFLRVPSNINLTG